jgi:putative FmdB family regulatory protein
MPLFTFVCPDCGTEKEVLMKASERETEVVWCPDKDCGQEDPETAPSRMKWKGIEGATVVRANGAYKFQLIDGSGGRHTSPKAESRANRPRRA